VETVTNEHASKLVSDTLSERAEW